MTWKRREMRLRGNWKMKWCLWFETIWALFYWNVRKTIYRVRKTQGICPCQNPSDSGEPMKTGCEAGDRHQLPVVDASYMTA